MTSPAGLYREIPLTKGYVALVDAEDYERLAKHRWQAQIGPRGVRIYARRSTWCNGKKGNMLMHREIMNAKDGEEIDHREGIGLDNRKSNLRRCTHPQNCANRRMGTNNTSGIKGVTFRKRSGRWIAQICFQRRVIHIGCYPDLDSAADAYLAKSKELNGEFARNW